MLKFISKLPNYKKKFCYDKEIRKRQGSYDYRLTKLNEKVFP